MLKKKKNRQWKYLVTFFENNPRSRKTFDRFSAVIGYVMLFFLAVFFSLFIVIPLLTMFGRAFYTSEGKFSTEGVYYLLFEDKYSFRYALYNSLVYACSTTFLCFIFALPLAVIHTRVDYKLKGLLSTLLVSSVITPPFVGTAVLQGLLAQHGPLNQFLVNNHILSEPFIFFSSEHPGKALIIMQTLHLFPLMFLYIKNTLIQIDPSLSEAAKTLGIPAWRRYKDLIFPLAKSGMLSGILLTFIKSFTDLGTPMATNCNGVLSILLLDKINSNPDYGYVILMITTCATFLLTLIFRRFSRADRRLISVSKTYKNQQLIRPKGLFYWSIYPLWGVILSLVYLPHILIFLRSFGENWVGTFLPQTVTLRFYGAAMEGKTWLSLQNSLQYALGATILMGLLGVSSAYIIVRKEGFWSRIIETLSMFPLLLPGVVFAFNLYLTYEGTWIGPDELPGFLVIVAYASRYLPYVVQSSVNAIQQIDPKLEEASYSFGANPLQTILRISIPIILPSVAASIFLGFSKSIFEVSSSFILATKSYAYPLAKIMKDLCHTKKDGEPRIAALGIIAMLIIALATYWAHRIERKKEGQIFQGME